MRRAGAVPPARGLPRVWDLMPALLEGPPGRGWLPEPARDASTVVLLVLDGLGWCDLRDHLSELPTLRSLEGGCIETVVPSTTAAALASITTGMSPLEHGILGYRMRLSGGVFNVLRWRFADGHEGPDPSAIQRWPPFRGKDIPVVTRSEFRHSGFAAAHLRVPRLCGWTTTAVLVEHVRRLVAHDESLVYAYYDGVDRVAHEYGLREEFFDVELASVDVLVGRLLDVLPQHVALLVTSDHGQVHVEYGQHLSLAPLVPLCEAFAGEGRFRSLSARRGRSRDLLVAAEEAFGTRAWIFARDRLIDEGWLGRGRPSDEVRHRIGDVVLAGREPVAFLDPMTPRERRLLGYHGSMTDREMLVPLLAARGRR